MGLLKPAVNQTAYLKAGILGFQGSGKTFTAIEIAVGLAKLVNGKKIAFFDTETGSDFHIKRVKAAGLQMDVVKTRAFTALCETVKEAETGEYTVLIIDSISHVWREITEAYKKRLNRKNGLYMQDWGNIKGQWQEFTDLYLNSRVHIIMLGRAGYEYDIDENRETGKKEFVKVGTKMKVEGEMGYEPSLLLEMVNVRKSEVTGNAGDKGFINRCIVLKDRTDTMNGKEIDNPKFKDFAPIIKFLNLGGEHIGVDTTKNSQALFESPDRSYAEMERRRGIALDELQTVLIKAGLDGTSAEAKKGRVELLEGIFGTASKTAIEGMKVDELEPRLSMMKARLGLGVSPDSPSFG